MLSLLKDWSLVLQILLLLYRIQRLKSRWFLYGVLLQHKNLYVLFASKNILQYPRTWSPSCFFITLKTLHYRALVLNMQNYSSSSFYCVVPTALIHLAMLFCFRYVRLNFIPYSKFKSNSVRCLSLRLTYFKPYFF